jgi:hypothetical protein
MERALLDDNTVKCWSAAASALGSSFLSSDPPRSPASGVLSTLSRTQEPPMALFRDSEGNFFKIPDEELARYKTQGPSPGSARNGPGAGFTGDGGPAFRTRLTGDGSPVFHVGLTGDGSPVFRVGFTSDGTPVYRVGFTSDGVPAFRTKLTGDGSPAFRTSLSGDGSPAFRTSLSGDGSPVFHVGFTSDGVPVFRMGSPTRFY